MHRFGRNPDEARREQVAMLRATGLTFTTGGLEHPGIVPVYGLGHYADGRPFYAGPVEKSRRCWLRQGVRDSW
jgi:hypothetical protein